MNENLNLLDILKDCPKGTKLYSPIFGEVEFEEVNDYEPYSIMVKTKNEDLESFTSDGRWTARYKGECMLFPSKEQRDWSKFKVKKSKFNPKTLNPFDKVLVRDSDEGKWTCTLYSHKDEDKAVYKYITIDYCYRYCIPYNEDTEHLVGTSDDAPEFYRYWKD